MMIKIFQNPKCFVTGFEAANNLIVRVEIEGDKNDRYRSLIKQHWNKDKPLERTQILNHPAYIVNGAIKCVTSTVCACLEDHPDEFVDQRRYYYNIEPYIKLFPKENIFIGFMEDLQSDGEVFFSKLCDFLQVEKASSIRNIVNPLKDKKVQRKNCTRIRRPGDTLNINKFVPQGVKWHVKEVLLKDVSQSELSISAETLIDIEKVLRLYSGKLLDYLGKPKRFLSFTNL